MIITCARTDNGFEINVQENGKIAATLKLQGVGMYLFVHNTVSLWTPRALKFYREVFALLKKCMKAAGYTFIITADRYNEELPMKEKYWRIMGFNIFKDFEQEGIKRRCAGLEL